MVRQSQLLTRALERTQRVGDLLLRREGDEERQVAALADELIAREYAAPSRERPCQDQARDCLACYQAHADDPTPCADAVAAYSRCARAASAEVLAAGTP
jgi:hypothetical protein